MTDSRPNRDVPSRRRKTRRDRLYSAIAAAVFAVAAAGAERMFVPSGAPLLMWVVGAVLALPLLAGAAGFAVGAATGVPVGPWPTRRQAPQLLLAAASLAVTGWLAAPAVGRLLAPLLRGLFTI